MGKQCGDKFVLGQKDIATEYLIEKQTIGAIHANNAGDHVLLAAVVPVE